MSTSPPSPAAAGDKKRTMSLLEERCLRQGRDPAAALAAVKASAFRDSLRAQLAARPQTAPPPREKPPPSVDLVAVLAKIVQDSTPRYLDGVDTVQKFKTLILDLIFDDLMNIIEAAIEGALDNGLPGESASEIPVQADGESSAVEDENVVQEACQEGGGGAPV